MKDYKKYIIALGLLTVSFSYIFISTDTGVARIFVNLLTFAGIYGLAAIGINAVSYTHLTLPTILLV